MSIVPCSQGNLMKRIRPRNKEFKKEFNINTQISKREMRDYCVTMSIKSEYDLVIRKYKYKLPVSMKRDRFEFRSPTASIDVQL